MNLPLLILLSAFTLSASVAESSGGETIHAKCVGDWISEIRPTTLTIKDDDTFLFHAYDHPAIGGTLERKDSHFLAQVIIDGKPHHEPFPIYFDEQSDMLTALSQLPKYRNDGDLGPILEKADVYEKPLGQFIRMGKPLKEEQIIGSWKEISRASDKEGYWAKHSANSDKLSVHWLTTYNKDLTGRVYRIIMQEERRIYQTIDEAFTWKIVGDTIVQEWKLGNSITIDPYRAEIEKDTMRFNLIGQFRPNDEESKRFATRQPDSKLPDPPEGFQRLDLNAFREALKNKATNQQGNE